MTSKLTIASRDPIERMWSRFTWSLLRQNARPQRDKQISHHGDRLHYKWSGSIARQWKLALIMERLSSSEAKRSQKTGRSMQLECSVEISISLETMWRSWKAVRIMQWERASSTCHWPCRAPITSRQSKGESHTISWRTEARTDSVL